MIANAGLYHHSAGRVGFGAVTHVVTQACLHGEIDNSLWVSDYDIDICAWASNLASAHGQAEGEFEMVNEAESKALL